MALVILPLHGDPPLDTTPILRENLVVASQRGPTRGRRSVSRRRSSRAVPTCASRICRTAPGDVPSGLRPARGDHQRVQEAGFEPRFAVEGGEMDAVLRFVEVGLDIAVVPSMVLAGRPGLRGTPLVLADEEARRGRHAPGLIRTIALAHRKDVELTHAARAFQDTLQTFLIEAGLAGSLPAGVETLVTS